MGELISVIVPVYNVYAYLEECVESIRQQTYKKIEIILVDDGSTDGSEKLCDEFALLDDRIKVIHKANGGLSSARNAGVMAASGQWIGFVDSDDIIAATMYETLYESATNKKCIPQIHLRGFVDKVERDKQNREIEQIELDDAEYFRQLLLHKGDSSACTKLFNIAYLKKNKFDEKILNEDFKYMIDLLRYSKDMRIKDINECLYFYRRREGSITNSGFSKAIIDSIYNADYAYEVAKEKYPMLMTVAQRFCIVQYEQFLRKIPINQMNNNNLHYKKAIKYIRRNIIKALLNEYVTWHEKRNIIAFAVMPKTAKIIYKNCIKK